MKYLLVLYLAFYFFSATAQQQSNLNQQIVSNYGYGTMIELKDINGRPIINKSYDPDIKGYPFLLEDWTDADLILLNGNQVKHVKMKLNIENNELNYLDSANRTIVLKRGIVREILFFIPNIKSTDTLILRNGFPSVDKVDSNTYYQVLARGAMTLLKLSRKSIAVQKNDLSGEISKEFINSTEYYIYYNNEIKMLKRNKQFFVDLMKNKRDFIEDNIEDKNINFKNIESLQRLVNLFNKTY